MIYTPDALKGNPTREDVLEFIAGASIYGNLGLFIGAGFSKAVLEHCSNKPLSWDELLEKVSTELKIGYKDIDQKGIDLPTVASKICKKYSDVNNIQHDETLKLFKEKIAANTCWYPDIEDEACRKWASFLELFEPSWIITTNYDLVIDSLLTGKSVSLDPSDMLVANPQIIPIYHLHGIRTKPENIVICKEDYISLFRPYEYRQIKLALTIKESTTLVLGYGFGDINISTAIDWSRHLFADKNIKHPQEVIQIVKEDNSKKEPYRNDNNILILEVTSLMDFFEEYKVKLKEVSEKNKSLEEGKKGLFKMLFNSHDEFLRGSSSSWRENTIDMLEGNIEFVLDFSNFLDKCFEIINKKSQVNGAFEEYNKWLNIILDVLEKFTITTIPPILLFSLAKSLNRLAPYIGYATGQSHAACNTWQKRCKNIPTDIKNELLYIADQYKYFFLLYLLRNSNTSQ